MEKICIRGGHPLEGTISTSGSKNSALALMAAALLAEGPTVFQNVPNISDIFGMADVLRSVGADVQFGEDHSVRIDATHIDSAEVSAAAAQRMRASFHVLGPILARKGTARVPMPGGCNIGARPVDLHLKGLERLGVEFGGERGVAEHGYVVARARQLQGNTILLRFPSAGATEHLITAACLAQGLTVIENAAAEPEIVDLANYLNAMGAHVSGAGTHTIMIRGVDRLQGTEYRVIPDRIEAGTYLCAGAASRGHVTVTNCVTDHLKQVIANLEIAGCQLDVERTSATVWGPGRLGQMEIQTMPYPGFPTDMQQPFGTLSSIATGTSIITETVYDNRFKYTDELIRMGADILVEGRTAIFRGVPRLTGAAVQATDLRSAAALLLAGLAAEGETTVTELQHLDRGYEDIVGKLQGVGARIERLRQRTAAFESVPEGVS